MDWQAHSPELNPIELLWKQLNGTVQVMVRWKIKPIHLVGDAQEAWSEIS